MAAVLTKAIAFIMIILTGYILKRLNVFRAKDFKVLSTIVIKITLPAAIVSNFSNMEMDHTLLIVCLIGFLANVILVCFGYLTHLGGSGDEKAFAMLNVSGYNIGNFTLPFIQNFLGTTGFAVTSLFDAGNALMCTGASYTAASAVVGNGKKVSAGDVFKSLFSSVPFDMYVIMTLLAIVRLRLPEVLISYAATIGNANAFIALLMIGIGFELHLEKHQVAELVKLLLLRYTMAAVFSLIVYWLLPLSPEICQTLAIVAFGPVSSVAPAFTGKLGGNVALASTINSLSIVISILLLTIALMVIL